MTKIQLATQIINSYCYDGLEKNPYNLARMYKKEELTDMYQVMISAENGLDWE